MDTLKKRLAAIGIYLSVVFAFSTCTHNAFAGTSWSNLTSQQQELLAPLKSDWNSLPKTHQERWIAIGRKYENESPDKQDKMRERVSTWTSLSSQEKAAARENYKTLKEQARGERNSSWNSYQTLDPKERGLLKEHAPVKATGNPR